MKIFQHQNLHLTSKKLNGIVARITNAICAEDVGVLIVVIILLVMCYTQDVNILVSMSTLLSHHNTMQIILNLLRMNAVLITINTVVGIVPGWILVSQVHTMRGIISVNTLTPMFNRMKALNIIQRIASIGNFNPREGNINYQKNT